jgi:hypothetical protein
MSALTHPAFSENLSDAREPATRHGGGLVWLTWRQHRWALLGSLLLTAVFVGWMTYLAIDLTSLYQQCHHTVCPPYSPQAATLSAEFGPLRQTQLAGLAVQYTPLLIGMFLGVPLLAREHEQRTLLLAWSQDVSPARWLWTKVALLGLYVAALTAVLSAATDHLMHVYTHFQGSLFNDGIFLISGVLPLAGGICWFAIGVALGALIRRTLPAIFASIAGFIGLLLAVEWRYPTLRTPLSYYRDLAQPGLSVADPNALVIKGIINFGPGSVANLYDAPGHKITYADLQLVCPNISVAQPQNVDDCLARNHLLTFVTYQPSSRIPEFHLIVAAGYLGLAAIALAAVWLIVRRTNLSAG